MWAKERRREREADVGAVGGSSAGVLTRRGNSEDQSMALEALGIIVKFLGACLDDGLRESKRFVLGDGLRESERA